MGRGLRRLTSSWTFEPWCGVVPTDSLPSRAQRGACGDKRPAVRGGRLRRSAALPRHLAGHQCCHMVHSIFPQSRSAVKGGDAVPPACSPAAGCAAEQTLAGPLNAGRRARAGGTAPGRSTGPQWRASRAASRASASPSASSSSGTGAPSTRRSRRGWPARSTTPRSPPCAQRTVSEHTCHACSPTKARQDGANVCTSSVRP
jgi:hypothetical protein